MYPLSKTTNGLQVTLREVVPCERYLSWLKDPEVTKYLEGNVDHNIWSLRRYVRERQEDSVFFGIYVRVVQEPQVWEDAYVGNIKVSLIRWKHRNGDMGVMIGEKRFWGKGIATVAIRLMVDHCFGLGFHCLTAGIIEGNLGSEKAFMRAGFKQVGTFPEFRWHEGKWKDEKIYAITSPNPGRLG